VLALSFFILVFILIFLVARELVADVYRECVVGIGIPCLCLPFFIYGCGIQRDAKKVMTTVARKVKRRVQRSYF
jgi:hypothetical protein